MKDKCAWIYHGATPTAGRKLLLLAYDELTLALPLIFRLIHPTEVELRVTWFQPQLGATKNISYLALIPLVQEVTLIRKQHDNVINVLVELNLALNRYFSDLGWRMVRKELSQLKKRQKKAHIELSKDLIEKLKRYMEEESLDSFDQAIDNLLEEAKVTHEN